jgi:signal transduction histidine kinase
VQAIGNVLGNAIKFTPDFGLIRVCTRLVMRPLLPERLLDADGTAGGAAKPEVYPYVEIAVIDSGIGIAREEQETIFDKFTKLATLGNTPAARWRSKGVGQASA